MNKLNKKYSISKLKGVEIFNENNFQDKRGILWASWSKVKLNKLKFNHDKFSVSKKKVLRGLHYDNKTWKLVSCAFGKVYFVVVNCDKKSKEYLKSFETILDYKKNVQILIPPNFANGHLCISDYCVFHYKLSYIGKYSDVKSQKVLKWNDNRINIEWPIKKNLILSERDK